MSNQLEFEICINRVKVYTELVKQALTSTDKYLNGGEVEIDFESNKSTQYAELIGRKVFFKGFYDHKMCYITFYNNQTQITTTMQIPVELIKFKEYE